MGRRFGLHLRSGGGPILGFLLALPCSGQGGRGVGRRFAPTGGLRCRLLLCLGGLRGILGRLLRCAGSLLRPGHGGVGFCQRLVRGGLGSGRVGHGLGRTGQLGLGRRLLVGDEVIGRLLCLIGLQPFRRGCLLGGGVRGNGLFRGGLCGDNRRLGLFGRLLGRRVGSTRRGLSRG